MFSHDLQYEIENFMKLSYGVISDYWLHGDSKQ